MEPLDALNLARLMLITATVVVTPPLLVVGGVGLVISLIQALTQVQEQSISFVPKLLAGIGTTLLLAPWMLSKLVNLAVTMLTSMGQPL
ncbi:MAG: flagellar biosynthetic protein FliQ [Vulcanimicrobiota bacterium]